MRDPDLHFKDCLCTVLMLITLVAPVPGGGRVDEVARWADLLVAGALGEAAQLLGGQQPKQERSGVSNISFSRDT